MAKYLDQSQFKSILSKSMAAIERVTSLPDAQDEDQLIITENAYISLGVIAMYQTHEPAHVKKFLELLPLKGDEESQEANALLLDQLLAKNVSLMSSDIQSVVKSTLGKISHT